MSQSLVPLIIVSVIILFAGFAFLAWHFEKKRREALAAEASGLGLRFIPGRNDQKGAEFGFINALNHGSNRYAENLVLGDFDGESVQCFDYHYETYSTDSKGNRKTDHHWYHIYALTLPKSFPEITIGPENIFTRFAKNFGYPSIDFESHEFSRKFLVQSPDKRFAYDVCHARMMEYLLQHPDLTLEIEGPVCALIFTNRRSQGELRAELERLVAIRRLLPEYLFAAA